MMPLRSREKSRSPEAIAQAVRMRISGGAARGVTLKVSKNAVHRPAMDRVRQGVFSSLGDRIAGAQVCDLFAGTGSYGLEALSRGAAACDFVEINKRAGAMIRDNLAVVAKSMGTTRLSARIHPSDALKWIPDTPQAYNLVFCDPPYDWIEKCAVALFQQFDRLLAVDGLALFEAPGELEPAAPGWLLRKRLGKGRNQPTVCFYERR